MGSARQSNLAFGNVPTNFGSGEGAADSPDAEGSRAETVARMNRF